MKRATLVLIAAICSAGCDHRSELDAPPPAVTVDVDSLPAMETSLIELPLSFDLTPILAQLEKAVPRRFGNINNKQAIPGNKRMHFAYAAERDPFVATIDGNTVRIRSVIHYAGRGWYNPPTPFAPEMSAACGTGDERPRAVIEMTADLELTPQWRLRSRSHVGKVAAYSEDNRDQCRITFLKMNVTDNVTDAARKQLQMQTKAVDAKLASLDVRSKFQEWWDVIAAPIHLTDSVWLQINPIAVSKGQTRGRNKMLNATVALSASPRIITGAKPATVLKPMPPLQSTNAGNGFHILMEGMLDYTRASDLMTEQLKGKRIEKGKRYVEVQSVRLFGIGGGKVALELRFKGTTGGRVFFVGTPSYDSVGDQLNVPDLDYDLASAGALVHGLAWMSHNDIRDFLRSKARWPVGGLLTNARKTLVDGLNREIAAGVRMSGEVTHVEALGVHAGLSSVVVRAHADGTVKLDVRGAAAKK